MVATENSFIVSLSDIAKTKWLSTRTSTCYFSTYELPTFLSKLSSTGYTILDDFVENLREGEYIPKKYYSLTETNYVYLSVGNFSRGEPNFNEIIYLDDEIGKEKSKLAVNDNDLIITRSGTVGKVSIFITPKELNGKIFIPSHHLSIIETDSSDHLLFLRNYLNYGFCQDFFNAYSTGKVQKEITNWSIRKLPIPLSLDKVTLTNKFKKIEKEITKQRKNLIELQESIDKTLKINKIKSGNYDTYRTHNIRSSLNEVAKNKALRIGAEYNDFWITHEGKLFDGSDVKYKLLPLKRVIYIEESKKFKKGLLDMQTALIDFEQVEARTGNILDYENYVMEIGSDKLIFGSCDILTNKLRPYLGYTILNQKALLLIGTTEFIPLKIRKINKVSDKYLRYLLLSYEYLHKSKLLMSGKQHPRINVSDLLNIRIPIPEKSIQNKIVSEIEKNEKILQDVKGKINNLRTEINTIIHAAL